MEYNKKTLDIATKKNDENERAIANANIGSVYHGRGDYIKAIELYSNSLDFFEKHDDTKNAAITYYNLASNYAWLKDYNNSYKSIKKSIKLYEELGEKYNISKANIQYAEIYLKDPANEGNLDSVLQCLLKNLEVYKNIGHLRGEGEIYSLIGYYYNKENDDKSAIEYFKKAIEISSDGEYKLDFAEYYMTSKEFDKAIDLLKNVIDNINETPFFKCPAYFLMSISLFSMEREEDSIECISNIIQYHSINKYVMTDFDFLDITPIVDEFNPIHCTLIKDLISLISNKTTYPIIRLDNVEIKNVVSKNYAELFHPFVGHIKITKDDDSLKKITGFLKKGDIVIDIDKSTVMGVERDTALLILGFLYKKEFIDYIEKSHNNLSIQLTDKGRKILFSS